ncbi:HAD-IB family phosphatase [Pelagicoccus albus]|uniref:phosphoserine phosphatase n=1 Tax=Pelagicoccus albus TaxID=415222 RepID=A0A7X1E8G1_9BACT|nr:HAD-IB family phosphatase [Pelagicoccus albus]MBC2604747.1 HAD-IB family phosphatase [Pelagicoccus albus]
MPKKILFFDCDSTLSSIEGIDELARLRGEETFRECENMTNRAMDGHIAIEDVYGARLDLIKPTAEECEKIGQLYIDTIESSALACLEEARSAGWEPIIVSGGLTQAIAPFAKFLGIEKVRAVDLIFDEQGGYAGFDGNCPTSRMGGKMKVIDADRSEGDLAVMVGDGSSDLETQPYVDLFIGYGGFLAREKVKSEAKQFVYKLSEIPALLP